MQTKRIYKATLFSVLAVFSLLYTSVYAAPNFPELTGRVVDNADILSSNEELMLSNKYAALENKTSAQLVLVTINSLNGYDIADYGYQLGRHWGIGQKDINNGLLIIISLQDRKMRIEVGYGLEGVITDAIAHNIVHEVMRPEFKKSNYYNGINKASDLLIKAVNKEPLPKNIKRKKKAQSNDSFVMPVLIFIYFLSGFIKHIFPNAWIRSGLAVGGGVIAGVFASSLIIGLFVTFILFLLLFAEGGGSSGGGYSGSYSGGSGGYGSGGFGGGFSGGGGSFGGGGASGGW